MKIGIIIHSLTGHTYSVAERMKEQLISSGHSVSIEKVTAQNDEEPNPEKIILVNIPELTSYDRKIALLFHGRNGIKKTF